MLVPAPARIDPGAAAFTLTPRTGVYAPQAPEVAALLRELLGPVTGFTFPQASEPGPDVIGLSLNPAGGEPDSEGYRLVVTGTQVSATAAGPAGLRWAVQALRQLLPPEIYGGELRTGLAWTVQPAGIVDVPRYPWRGLMVDVGRWYKPIGWLYTVVDLLATHRMNVLHLHLTEDQGWRFEVLKYPELTRIGGFRTESPLGHGSDRTGDGVPHGGYYTQAELRDLVAFAARRGVTVVPEIDLPGHTQAAIAAYPRLGNVPDRRLAVWTGFGISPHVLNVEDETVRFVEDVLDELLDVFPSKHIHLGGDEVEAGEWAGSAAARARMLELGLAEPQDLLGWWMRRLSDHLERRGRTAVLWDDLVGQGAPPGAVIMAWRNDDRVRAAIAAGHRVVATPHTSMYLNYPSAAGPGEPLSIADGVTSDPDIGVLPLARVYAYDPPENSGTGGVIGVQGNLWTEYAPTPGRAEYDLMPRLAAVAEVGWGGPRDQADLDRRLVRHLQRMDAAGVGYRPPD
jgi:hexosaminidase